MTSPFAPRPQSVAPAKSAKETLTPRPSEVSMFTLRMDRELHRRLKRRAFDEERTMKEILEELVAEYLDSRQ